MTGIMTNSMALASRYQILILSAKASLGMAREKTSRRINPKVNLFSAEDQMPLLSRINSRKTKAMASERESYPMVMGYTKECSKMVSHMESDSCTNPARENIPGRCKMDRNMGSALFMLSRLEE